MGGGAGGSESGCSNFLQKGTSGVKPFYNRNQGGQTFFVLPLLGSNCFHFGFDKKKKNVTVARKIKKLWLRHLIFFLKIGESREFQGIPENFWEFPIISGNSQGLNMTKK